MTAQDGVDDQLGATAQDATRCSVTERLTFHDAVRVSVTDLRTFQDAVLVMVTVGTDQASESPEIEIVTASGVSAEAFVLVRRTQKAFTCPGAMLPRDRPAP